MPLTSSDRPVVVLVGPPGAGKTTVGRLLGDALQVAFLDSDHEVERTTGTSVPDLFRTRGEEAFRRLEHEVVTRLLREFDGVLALGGGAVLDHGTQEALRGHLVVFLDVDVAQALPRVSLSGERPLLAQDPVGTFQALLRERRPIYEAVAEVVVTTTGRRPQDVAEEILAALRERGRTTLEPGAAHQAAARPAPPTRIAVAGAQAYDVLVGRDLAEEVVELVGEAATRVLVLHPATLSEQTETVRAALETSGRRAWTRPLPDAERAKTIEVVSEVWDLLGEHRFGREDTVVGVGGGATTDVAGFIAATWLRGVRLVNVPTTLLGMVDAAVGGKTGINTSAGKNLVGSFHPPAGVVCDLAALATLPEADLRAGLAEVIKCGFIADEQILRLVEADGGVGALDRDSDVLRELVERAVAVKARVVGEDLRESGLREILNYGHTLAHAIEHEQGYRWRHGDAVAVGMVFAAELAVAAGVLDPAVAERHRAVLSMVGLPVSYPGGSLARLEEAMRRDKKVRGDALRFIVLEDVGRPTILRAPTPEQLSAAFARIS